MQAHSRRTPRRTLLRWTLTAAALPMLAATAFAQTSFPSKPITLVVPYAAGGLTDQLARELGAEGFVLFSLTEKLAVRFLPPLRLARRRRPPN